MRVRIDVEIESRAVMRRIAHAMLTGGYLYGGVTVDSPRPALMARLREYIADNGATLVDDPDEWYPQTVMLTARLWRDR
jgi:hypothetical protein